MSIETVTMLNPSVKWVSNILGAWYHCSYCENRLRIFDKYCSDCGQGISWENCFRRNSKKTLTEDKIRGAGIDKLGTWE